MEIKATLEKPFTEDERINFIVENNHKLGYEIRETDEELQAWGKTDEENLEQAKQAKYQEANSKANEFLQSGEALYEFEEGKHIEATDGNIAKMNAYLTGLQAGAFEEVTWVSKEDEILTLNAEDVTTILLGLGQVQANVWSIRYPTYIKAIEQAETVEEIKAIIIDYTLSPEEG